MWRYRVVRTVCKFDDDWDEEEFAIHEHYTNSPGGDYAGESDYGPNGVISAEPIAPGSGSVAGLREDLEDMMGAFDHPVLEYSTFNEEEEEE